MFVLRNGATALAGEMQQLPSSRAQLVASRSRRRRWSVRAVRRTEVNLNMNGLRIYVHSQTFETCGGRLVFYSRREDGPYYRWSYDENLSKWQAGRVLKTSPKLLSPAVSKEIPAGLKRDIVEHYQD